jgi:hypothetical protein
MHYPDAHRAAETKSRAPTVPQGDGQMERLLERLKLLAPRAGFEPATIRLTVECSTAELPRNKRRKPIASGQRITKPIRLA